MIIGRAYKESGDVGMLIGEEILEGKGLVGSSDVLRS